jgi:hypothetical protein
MLPYLPIAGYSHRGMNTYDPRMSVHEQNVLDDRANILHNMVDRDHGLSNNKKKHLTTMLNSPEYIEHLMAGTTGTMLMHSIHNYSKLPKPVQSLLSLAGFGIGNIIYNELHEDRFSEYNPSSGKSRIKY